MKNFFKILKSNTFNLALYYSHWFMALFLGIFLLFILYFTNLLFPVIFITLILLDIIFIISIGIFILYSLIYYTLQNFIKIFYKYPGFFKVILCVSILLLLLLLCLLNFVFLEIYAKRLLQILPIVLHLVITIISMYCFYKMCKPEILFFINIYYKYIFYFFIFILVIILFICFVLSSVDIAILEVPNPIQNLRENSYFPANAPLDFDRIIDKPALFIQEDLNFQKDYSQFKSNINRVKYILDGYTQCTECSESEKTRSPMLKEVGSRERENLLFGELDTLRSKIYNDAKPLLAKLEKIKDLESQTQDTFGKTYYRDNYNQLYSDIKQYEDLQSKALLASDPNKVKYVK